MTAERELGLATGICGALAYTLFEVSLLGGFSYFAVTNFNAWFGWELPWILFALFAAGLISVLCWFDVELSVKVLGTAQNGKLPVHVRGTDGLMNANDLQDEQLLELVFVDVGQGDG